MQLKSLFAKDMQMKSFALAAALLAALGMAKPADAVQVTYDMTLTATGIGTVLPVFGISGLPAGPFTGSFSFDSPLTPNESFLIFPLTAFSLTIGNDTWSNVLGDDSFARFSTDGAGAIITSSFFMDFRHPNSGNYVEMEGGNVANLGWFAFDRPVNGFGFCGFDTEAPYVGPDSGNCIGGGPGTIALVERQSPAVPEPETYAMMLAGLGLLGFAARRRRQQAA